MNDHERYGESAAEQCSRGESVKTAITLLLIGAGVGALLSLLLAPRLGPEFRQAVREKFDGARRGLGEQTSRLRRRTSEIAGQARDKVMPIRRTR